MTLYRESGAGRPSTVGLGTFVDPIHNGSKCNTLTQEEIVTRITRDGEVIDNLLAIDTVGSTVALHHEAILALMDEIESLKARLEKYKSMAG